MRKFMKKLAVIGIIILFLTSVNLIKANSREESVPFVKGKILYVGGNGQGNYSTIQEAINNSIDGDTVFVYNGVYSENIMICKKINLIGEDRNSTIIDGNMKMEFVVRVLCDLVNISGFTVIHAGDGIQIFSNHSTVTNIILTENIWYGIAVYNGCYTIIDHNRVFDNSGGIYLQSNQNNRVSKNIIIGNSGSYTSNGICLESSSFNEINGNLVKYSTVNILLHWSCNNTIHNNVIENSLGRGIYLFFMSHYNIIANNTFNDSWIEIEANGNQIVSNNFFNYSRYIYFVVHNQFFTPQFNYNKFDRNYWDNWIGLSHHAFSKCPKVIVGVLDRKYRIPILAFDWHPAKEPYYISR